MDVFIDRPDICNEIIKTLKSNSHKRRLCVLFGEWGIGKSTLLNKIFDDLKYKLRIRIDFTLEDYAPYALKDVVADFIEHSGVYYSNIKSNDKVKLRDRLFKGLKDLNFGITIQANSQGTVSGGLSFNFVTAVVNFIEKKYESYIGVAQNASFDDFPKILARITREICEACDNVLYIVIDDIEKMNEQTVIYLRDLLSTDLKIALVISSEFGISSKSSTSFTQILYDHFVAKRDTNDKYEYELSYFELEETHEYIKKSFKNLETLNIDVSRLVQDYTKGFPLLLSLICNDISNIEKINQNVQIEFNSKFKLYYEKLLDNLTEAEQKILIITTCNKSRIHFDVLKEIILKFEHDELTFLDSLEHLINGKHIKEQNDIIFVNSPMLADYINRNSKYLKDTRKKEYYYKCLKNAYSDLPDSKSVIDKYHSLAHVNINLGNFKEANSAINRCVDELINNQLPDMAVKFLNEILDMCKVANYESLHIFNFKFKLCKSYFLCRKMDLAISIFIDLTDSEINYLRKESKYLEMLLIASKSYYYMNKPHESIKYAKMAINENPEDVTKIYFEAKSMISSSQDLLGKYPESRSTYFEALLRAQNNNFTKTIGEYKMIIQMISSDYNECISSLEDAIHIFTEKYTTEHRNLACCYNNIGIEYLMGGDFQKSKQYLLKAEQTFSSFPLESHFTDNNLGLFFYLSDEKNIGESLKYLKRAYDNSISPLQHAYSMANRGIVLYENGKKDDALSCFNVSYEHVKDCPDPIVKSYIEYNLACYHFKSGDLEKADLYLRKHNKDTDRELDKDQLKLFLIKRENLSNQIKGVRKEPSNIAFEKCQRRRLFAQCEWEPCELMFYN